MLTREEDAGISYRLCCRSYRPIDVGNGIQVSSRSRAWLLVMCWSSDERAHTFLIQIYCAAKMVSSFLELLVTYVVLVGEELGITGPRSYQHVDVRVIYIRRPLYCIYGDEPRVPSWWLEQKCTEDRRLGCAAEPSPCAISSLFDP